MVHTFVGDEAAIATQGTAAYAEYLLTNLDLQSEARAAWASASTRPKKTSNSSFRGRRPG